MWGGHFAGDVCECFPDYMNSCYQIVTDLAHSDCRHNMSIIFNSRALYIFGMGRCSAQICHGKSTRGMARVMLSHSKFLDCLYISETDEAEDC